LYQSKERIWSDNKGRIYNLSLQHCSTKPEVKLKALAEWPTINADRDVIKLIMMVRTITHQHDETKQGTAALVDSDVRLYSYTQGK